MKFQITGARIVVNAPGHQRCCSDPSNPPECCGGACDPQICGTCNGCERCDAGIPVENPYAVVKHMETRTWGAVPLPQCSGNPPPSPPQCDQTCDVDVAAGECQDPNLGHCVDTMATVKFTHYSEDYGKTWIQVDPAWDVPLSGLDLCAGDCATNPDCSLCQSGS